MAPPRHEQLHGIPATAVNRDLHPIAAGLLSRQHYHALRKAAGVSRPPGPFQAPPARRAQEKLVRFITARFTATEAEALVDHARHSGSTLAALIRKLVLGYDPGVHQPVIRSAIAAVHRAGVNLQRMIELAGSGAGVAPDLQAAAELRDEIHALRDALLRADAAGAPDPDD
jgi:hypothetical protein